MHIISAELLAAATSGRGRPVVHLDVVDRRLRWGSACARNGSTQWCDQVGLPGGILRARVTASGLLQTCLVQDAGVEANWMSWSTVRDDALPDGDVALCREPGGGRVRLLYAGAAGALQALLSSDGGASWQPLPDVAAGLAAPLLAAAGATVFWTAGGQVQQATAPWEGGVWVAGAPCPLLPALASPQGLSAAADDAGLILLLAAADGRLWRVTAEATGAWSDCLQVAPGGDGAPAAGYQIRAPGVLAVGGEWLGTWVEELAGPGGWVQPVAARSVDGVHWGDEVALAVWGEPCLRVAPALAEDGRTLYAGNENCVCVARRYDAADPLQHRADLLVPAYRREVDEEGGRLQLELLDPAGELAMPGQEGAPGGCLRPLATLSLRRGYLGAGGAMEVTADPHYLLQVEEGGGRDAGRLWLRAVDGWGLLARWRAGETLLWEDRSLAWLLGEMCARVGLRLADAIPALETTLPRFAVLPGEDAATAVRRLLGLGGCVARWDAAGDLAALEPASDYPLEQPLLGAAGEIWRGRYGCSALGATSFRAYGDGVAAAAELGAESMALGLRSHRVWEDHRLNTQAAIERVQLNLWTMGRAGGRTDRVTVPLRPELELWDVAGLRSPRQIAPADSLRRITGIVEEYDGPRGLAQSVVTLAGV